MPQDNRGYSTGPGSGVDINIGATPGMSANARAVLQQMMSRPSDNWGSAVSRLGAAFALGHAEKRRGRSKKRKRPRRWHAAKAGLNPLGAECPRVSWQ